MTRGSGLDRIVVGTTLGAPSDPVVASAAVLARLAGARLTLVHALSGDVSEEVGRAEAAKAMVNLKRQTERIGAAPLLEADLRVEAGPAHRELVEIADEIGAGLLVLGASEEHGPLSRILGSTADRVVRKATCPVLVNRGRFEGAARKVLLPVDLSPLSEDAFACGLDILTWLGADGLEPRALMVLSSLLEKTYSFRYEVKLDQVPLVARAELDEFLDRHVEGRPEVDGQVRMGEVAEGIIEELKEWGADLVVMGTHGRGGFERFLIGSVTSRVVRDSSCSVLVIPPEVALRAGHGEAHQTRSELR